MRPLRCNCFRYSQTHGLSFPTALSLVPPSSGNVCSLDIQAHMSGGAGLDPGPQLRVSEIQVPGLKKGFPRELTLKLEPEAAQC